MTGLDKFLSAWKSFKKFDKSNPQGTSKLKPFRDERLFYLSLIFSRCAILVCNIFYLFSTNNCAFNPLLTKIRSFNSPNQISTYDKKVAKRHI